MEDLAEHAKQVQVVERRNKSDKSHDKIWRTPSGARLRSKKAVRQFLDIVTFPQGDSPEALPADAAHGTPRSGPDTERAAAGASASLDTMMSGEAAAVEPHTLGSRQNSGKKLASCLPAAAQALEAVYGLPESTRHAPPTRRCKRDLRGVSKTGAAAQASDSLAVVVPTSGRSCSPPAAPSAAPQPLHGGGEARLPSDDTFTTAPEADDSTPLPPCSIPGEANQHKHRKLHAASRAGAPMGPPLPPPLPQVAATYDAPTPSPVVRRRAFLAATEGIKTEAEERIINRSTRRLQNELKHEDEGDEDAGDDDVMCRCTVCGYVSVLAVHAMS